jgi:hypothetical protein
MQKGKFEIKHTTARLFISTNPAWSTWSFDMYLLRQEFRCWDSGFDYAVYIKPVQDKDQCELFFLFDEPLLSVMSVLPLYSFIRQSNALHCSQPIDGFEVNPKT